MHGIISIKKNGPIARCGFKYVGFDPQLTMYPNGKSFEYHGIRRHFASDKLVFELTEDQIIKDTMTRIMINDCKFLNSRTHISLDARMVCVSYSEFELYPMTGLMAASNGIVFCDSDYIMFHPERKIESSSRNYLDEDMWSRLEKEHPAALSFVRGLSNNNPHPVMSQDETNSKHLSRFEKQYGEYFLNEGLDLTKFGSMDVIDIKNIDQIEITRPELMKTYPVFEIFPNSAKIRGHGINGNCFSEIRSAHNKFLFMAIDCDYHSISIKPNIRLHIRLHTHLLKSDGTNSRRLVFIKFDKKSLHKYNHNFVIRNM
jgi:hypothetical protein